MTDYTWPEALAPFGQDFWLQPHVGRSESPFTRQQKIYGLSAPRWRTRLATRGGYRGSGLRGKGAAVDAFVAKLEGGLNRALIYDFRRPGPSVDLEEFSFDDDTTFDDGEGFEDDLIYGVNDAAAAGDTLFKLTGCGSGNLLFRAGDYVGGDGRPHIVLDDVESDAGGTAFVTFKPALSSAVAAGDWTFRKVTAPFRLVSDDAGQNPAEVGGLETLDLEFVEDL